MKRNNPGNWDPRNDQLLGLRSVEAISESGSGWISRRDNRPEQLQPTIGSWFRDSLRQFAFSPATGVKLSVAMDVDLEAILQARQRDPIAACSGGRSRAPAFYLWLLFPGLEQQHPRAFNEPYGCFGGDVACHPRRRECIYRSSIYLWSAWIQNGSPTHRSAHGLEMYLIGKSYSSL